MTHIRETTTNEVKMILPRAIHEERTTVIEMQGAMIHYDGGYNDDKFFCFRNKVNASVFFTVKRGPTIHFVFSATYYRRSREQEKIPENGCHPVSTRDINGKKLYLTAYCNGTVRAVFFATSN
jgi:hypothetical protein